MLSSLALVLVIRLPYAPEYVEVLSTYSGAYGSHTIGHSVGPLVLTQFIDK